MSGLFSNFEKVVPNLLGLLTLLSTFLLTWLKDLSQVSRRTRVLAEATQRQAFWNEQVGSLNACSASYPADRAAAEREIRRSARAVRQLYRYVPLPARWTPKAYRGYLEYVRFFRRVFVAYAMPTPKLVSYQRSFRLAVVMYLGSGLLLSWLRNGHPGAIANPFWLWFATSIQHHNRVYLNALAICYLCFLVVMVTTRIRLEILQSTWLANTPPRLKSHRRAGLG